MTIGIDILIKVLSHFEAHLQRHMGGTTIVLSGC